MIYRELGNRLSDCFLSLPFHEDGRAGQALGGALPTLDDAQVVPHPRVWRGGAGIVQLVHVNVDRHGSVHRLGTGGEMMTRTSS